MARPKQVCSIEDCDREHDSRGYCSMHIRRLRRVGDVNGRMGIEAIRRRFEQKIVRVDNGCLEWTSGLNNKGRPMFGIGGRTGGYKLASHVSWFLHYGVWPKQQLNHNCDNGICVDVDHVYEGTQKQNMRDFAERSLTCPRGHPRDEANTQTRKDGSRYCKTCQNQARRDRKAGEV